MKRFGSVLVTGAAGGAIMLMAAPARAEMSSETQYVFNTFSFLVHGFLVMWMGAGFAMLESGLVRTKNTATICLKNVALYSLAGVLYYLIGYNLMYGGAGGWFGKIALFIQSSPAELALLNADTPTPELTAQVAEAGYAAMSDWFFQMVFVATAASIVSGTIAERVKIWPFLLFVVVLTGIIYPVQGAWTWGGGWLSKLGFTDFAGSTIVHSVGGWAALTGAVILGPRRGKYGSSGRVMPLPGANLPLATLGTFILWFGWFGFNGGSQLALGSALDATAMAIVYANTNLGAAAGLLTALALTQVLYKKIDLTLTLNGAIAGLVSITAGPDLPNHALAIVIGSVGGALAVIAVPLLDRLRIDDVVGAISAHLVAGIWGTLAVAIFGTASFMAQITGIAAIGAFVIVTSAVLWLVIKHTIGLRANTEDEEMGLDKAELGMEAYPEFGHGSQTI